jgi:hypothetical protein
MKDHRSCERYRNFYKICRMGTIRLVCLETVLNLLLLKSDIIRRVHWVGMQYPERKKYILRFLNLRFHIWVSVDRSEDHYAWK